MALFDESFSEEEDNTIHILSLGRSQSPASPASGDSRPASNAWSSRYHPCTHLQDRMQEDEDSTEDEKPPMDPEDLARIVRRILETTLSVSEVDKPVTGPSRPQEQSPVRYSVSQNRSTYIHGFAPIMSPQVLVRCPPFPPCPPPCPSPPVQHQGAVYLHQGPLRPPNPYPPSPPPPDPRPEVYQQAPFPVLAAPAAPVALVPDLAPWWMELLQGPQRAMSTALLQQYLTLLEYTVDNYYKE